MANGKGSLRRPLGRISEAELHREWKRIFGRTRMPRNKRAAVAALLDSGQELSAKQTPEEFVARERAALKRMGYVPSPDRLEQIAHMAGCRCYTCEPRRDPESTAPVTPEPEPPALVASVPPSPPASVAPSPRDRPYKIRR